MTEPVLMDKNELAAMAKDMKRVVELNDSLKRDLKVALGERDEARVNANRFKTEGERLRKTMPADKMADENKGLRTGISESHKRIGVLEKELAAAKDESEARRKEVVQLNQRIGNVQNTFDMMQVARDKACADRDKLFADLQAAGDAYHKLQGEFNDFKKAAAEAKGQDGGKGKAQQQEAKK